VSGGLPPTGSLAPQVRARARDHARTLSTGVIAVLGMLGALALVGAFVLLDYTFEQDAHRLAKLLFGGAGMVALVTLPKMGLLLLPIATPLLALFPKMPLPGLNTVNVLFFSVFFSYALAHVLNRRPWFRSGRLTLPIVALIGIAALSILRGAAFPTGMQFEAAPAAFALFRCAMSFAAYFVGLSMVRGEKERRRLTWAILAGLAAETYFTFKFGRDLHGRSTGTIGQSNELGTYLAMFMVFAVAVGFGVRAVFGRILIWGLAGAAMVGVFMSVSRASIMALVAGTLLVAARSSRMALVMIVLITATSPLWAPDYVKERIATTVESESDDEIQIEGGAEARLDTWQTVLRIAGDHVLDGIGFTGLGYVLPQLSQELGLNSKDSAHNTFLRLLAETGILGLIAFLVVLWGCWRLSRQGTRKLQNRFDRQVAVGLEGMLIALVIACAFGDRFFEIMITGNFWLACALVEGALIEQPAPAPVLRAVRPSWYAA
jgi:O-antigen ligase